MQTLSLKLQRLAAKRTLLTNVIAGPILLLILALAGLAVEMSFLSDQHSLLKRQQVLADAAARLNIALKKQSQYWQDYLLDAHNDKKLWMRFRQQERDTLAQANALLVQVDRDQLQKDVRNIVYALEILRISYQESRSEHLKSPDNFIAINQQIRRIDETPSALIENLYQKIQLHASSSSDTLRQRALIMSAFFALLLVIATLVYSRWSCRHTQSFLHRQTQHQQRVEWLLKHDYLTQLLTRSELTAETDKKIAQDHSLYAFHFSLSNIKDAAHSQGHSLHDQLIRIAARRLTNEKRSQDILARSIGEEFILIVEDDDELAMRSYAKQLLSHIEEDFTIAGFRYHIACSLGISHYPTHADSTSELLRCADIAAVQARSLKLQCPSLYSPIMSQRIRQKSEWVDLLRNAVANNEIDILFQPQVAMTDRRITGVEVLTRLSTNTPAINFPDVFIPLAEETGLIHPLGRAVCRQALSELKRWVQHGYDINMAINVSSRQLESDDFVEFLTQLCHEHQLPTHKIDIELTESNYIDHGHHQFDLLRKAGFRISIDDFGTGYSNLGYLSRFVPQQLKIDKSFINSMTHSERRYALVESIIGLAKNQTIEVVAEGIETEIQAHLLKRLGVDIGQGYLFSRPENATTIDALLAQQADDQRRQSG